MVKCSHCHHELPNGRKCRRCKRCNKVYMRIYRRNLERASAALKALTVLELPPPTRRFPGVDMDAIYRRSGS